MLVGIPPYYDNNINKLYENIKKDKLKIPKYLSQKAQSCLYKILEKDAKKRISMEQLKQDPFFAEIDWAALLRKEIDPPQVLVKEPTNDEKTRYDAE